MGSVVELAVYGLVAGVIYLLWVLYRDFQSARGRDLLVDVDEESEELKRLAELKTRLLQDIKGLEFDFDTGHLTENDYKQLRGRLEKRAIAAMKKLDRLRGETDFDAMIDAELDRRDGVEPSLQAKPPVLADAAVSADGTSTTAHGACGACGHTNKPGAKFCAECGAGLLRHCGACDTQNRAEAKFCRACGKSMTSHQEEAQA